MGVSYNLFQSRKILNGLEFYLRKIGMLHIKSKPEDIAHHILQMELLLLSEKEKAQISQILALENLLKDDAIKGLIEEDLKDEKWIEDTNILINTCYNKIEKTLLVEEHITQCRNFMVFRYMEAKCSTCKIEVFKQIGGWIFNEIDNKNEKSRWVSQKFLRNFEISNVPTKLIEIMETTTSLEITLQWLHKNREAFFKEEVFMDLNTLLKEKSVLRM